MEYAWPKTLEQHLHSLFSLARVLCLLIARPLERRWGPAACTGNMQRLLSKTEPSPHLKAQAGSISNGEPLSPQPLNHLHVPQQRDKPCRHLPKAGTLCAKAIPASSCTCLCVPSNLPQKNGQDLCFFLAMLLSHIYSWVPHIPSQPRSWAHTFNGQWRASPDNRPAGKIQTKLLRHHPEQCCSPVQLLLVVRMT